MRYELSRERPRAWSTVALAAGAALVAVIAGWWVALLLPLVFLTLGRGAGAPWGVLAVYWMFQSAWLLLLGTAPERALLWLLLGIGLWVFKREQVHAVWRGLRSPAAESSGRG
jgi:hypothetical protein